MKLQSIIGQNLVKKTLQELVISTQKTKQSVPHILLLGPSGYGKTSLAKALAADIGTSLHTINAASIKRKSDMIDFFTKDTIKANDIMFFDEIHRLGLPIQEILYTIMEEFYINIEYQGEFMYKYNIPPFTLLGATTETVSIPMTGRFGHVLSLAEYSKDEIEQIIEHYNNKLPIKVDPSIIYGYSRGIPREAKRLAKWISDYCIANNQSPSKELIGIALQQIGIHKNGLKSDDLLYLSKLKNHKKHIGLHSIAAICNISPNRILYEIEPHLVRLGYIYRTSVGRRINLGKVKEWDL